MKPFSLLSRRTLLCAYAVAILGPAVVTSFRLAIEPWAEGRVGFLFFTVPVAIAASLGGLRPGVVATTLGLLCGIYFFQEPLYTFQVTSTGGAITVLSFAAIWLFISLVCDLLRNVRTTAAVVTRERDSANARLADTLDRISDGVYIVDSGWRMVLANRALAELVGSTPEALVGRNLWDIFAQEKDKTVRARMEAVAATGELDVIEVHDPDGGRWFQLRVFPNSFPAGVVVYVQDITDEKAVAASRERELALERAARSDAEQANRMKDEFVAMVSHEVRTPLTAILGWSEILRSRPGINSELADGLAQIDSAARHQARLIDDLLDLSRMNTGQLRIDFQPVDLKRTLEQVVKEALASRRLPEGHVRTDLPSDMVIVSGDPHRIGQIFGNLLGNALKFSPANVGVSLSLRTEGGSAVIEIADRGEGIDPAILPVIFERFRQANSSTSRRFGGLGLGLAIVRQLVELHGGTVTAASEGLGKGATFTVTLPLGSGSPYQAPEPFRPSLDLSGVRIMVVEDDDATRRVLTTMLSLAGADVTACSSAKECLDCIVEARPEILLSDIGMPEMDGYAFIRAIRDLDDLRIATVPAIALTAFARPADQQRALESGFDGYLSKPIQLDDLAGEIARVKTLREELD